MDDSAIKTRPQHDLARQVRLHRWFAIHAALVALAAAPLVVSYHRDARPFNELAGGLGKAFHGAAAAATGNFAGAGQKFADAGAQLHQAVSAMPWGDKLLIFMIYLSLCTTVTPLATGWIVSALAIRGAAVGHGLADTVATVALAGAFASTVANLTDYHIFLGLLRSRRISSVRHVRGYERLERWFGRSPFAILLVFGVLPIPVDVARMLAALYGYPRTHLAIANFLGRLLRYSIIAGATYMLGSKGWAAPLALLALAAALVLIKATPMAISRLRRKPLPVREAN
jgi:membrane protein YqaA with SNARE-associated domain